MNKKHTKLVGSGFVQVVGFYYIVFSFYYSKLTFKLVCKKGCELVIISEGGSTQIAVL